MRGYYRFHAHIYDSTRWTFLFGRKAIIDLLRPHVRNGMHIAEVGCGSGFNLKNLADNYPEVRITGIDISADMLQKAYQKNRQFGDRVELKETLYTDNTFANNEKPDIILFSYCLTMINPDWPKVIEHAWKDLPEGGIIAVVDFHNSPIRLFEKWMGVNHVRMDGHLLPILEKQFNPEKTLVRKAYSGIWRYFLFTGKKQNDH